MKKTRWIKLLAVTALVMLMTVLGVISASADDLVMDLLHDELAGFRLEDTNGGVWQEKTDADGSVYLYNANGRRGALNIYDEQNILGTYQTFSVEGDFYFESFAGGLREEKYTAEEKPLSFICWNWKNKAGEVVNYNAIRLDSEGYIYTDTMASSKTLVKLELGEWYNIRIVMTPKSGQCEMYINGEKELDYMIPKFDMDERDSSSVRYFDSFYTWNARMKNLFVKTDSDYVIGEREEPAADYIGYQVSKPAEDGTFSMRAILGIEDLAYNRIGYEIILLEKDGGEVIAKTISDRAKTVYQTLSDAQGNTYNVMETFGYPYAAAIEVPGLPVDPESGAMELVVRPYVLGMNGIRMYGDAMILAYVGDADEAGYPVLLPRADRFRKVYVSDDSLIYDSMEYKYSNFGDSAVLQARNLDEENKAPERAAYFKFTLDPETAKMIDTAASAKLYVCVQNLGAVGTTFYDLIVQGTGTNWTEDTLLYQDLATQAPILDPYLGQASYEDELYFSVEILDYIFEQELNDDGSLTVSFRVTTEGHSDAALVYLYAKEHTLNKPAYIEIVTTTYDLPLNIEKYANNGYEPWGYAEYLVNEWFNETRDLVRPKDENGKDVLFDIDDFDANGYDATEATGDFTREIPWTQLEFTTTPSDNYTLPKSQWKTNRFARTLSTLGTSTANAFLASEHATLSAEYDSYGGITNAGFTGEVTGFFHVETHNGRPYLIDPLGNPFFVVGMNDVTLGNTQNQRDYSVAKYGSRDAYFENITHSLQGMGVNVAQVSDNDALLAVEDGLNVVVSIGTVGSYMKTIGRTALNADGAYPYNNTRCIFDPDYVKETNKTVRRTIQQYGYADNPHILGYTTDNELPSELNMLERYLTLDPLEERTNAFSYATAWTWLAKRMNNPYPTLEDFRNHPENEAMSLEFMGFWYARYYKVVSEAIEAADPNHMYMGSRANLNSLTEPWIIKAAGCYTDMITANLYGGMNPSIDTIVNLYRYSGIPFMVTEFFAKSSDAIDANGYKLANSTGAGILVQTQQERADYYEHYTLALLESKACVGWTWYRFRDNDQSLYQMAGSDKLIYMWSMSYGASDQGPIAWKDGEGNVYPNSTATELAQIIYSGDGIGSNQNVNKGIYNSNFNSAVSVYTYDQNGTLVSSMSYEVKTPESETPEAGTKLKALKGTATYTIGRVENADGGYTETILTVYEGKYIAFANSIKNISKHLIGLVGYFDAE